MRKNFYFKCVHFYFVRFHGIAVPVLEPQASRMRTSLGPISGPLGSVGNQT